jgi:hypothetical protein
MRSRAAPTGARSVATEAGVRVDAQIAETGAHNAVGGID